MKVGTVLPLALVTKSRELQNVLFGVVEVVLREQRLAVGAVRQAVDGVLRVAVDREGALAPDRS
jgi:hypothetical protein